MDALRGIWLVLRTPRLWPLCIGPLLGAAFAYAVLGIVGGILLVPRLPGWLGIDPANPRFPLAELLGGAVFVALWLFLFSWAFVLIAGVFAGFIFDKLSREVERVITAPGEAVPDVPLTFSQTAGDSVSRLLLNASLGIAALFLSVLLGPIPGILAAAIVGLLDFTSPAYLRRGLTLGPQSGRILRRLDSAALSFAILSGLLSLVPFVGVFLLPGFVAGGTMLVRRREEAATPPPAG